MFSIFELLELAFSTPHKFSQILTPETSRFYIRLCHIKFIKIYSHLSNKEMLEINKKIVDKKVGLQK